MTDDQRRAVERLGQDVCVVAGPGSGKTTVLVARFEWLVETQGVSPQRILVITFTEKAASDLKRRLSAKLGSHPSQRERLERAPISTIHGFCASVLREFAIEAGIDPEFTVLDEAGARVLARTAVDSALNDRLHRDRASLIALYEAWDTPDPAEAIARAMEAYRLSGDREPWAQADPLESALAAASHAVGSAPSRSKRQDELRTALALWIRDPQGAPPDAGQMTGPLPDAARALEEALTSHRYSKERSLLAELIGEANRQFRDRKQARSAVDFQDLESLTIHLLETEEALAHKIRQRYEYILMDEVQDTNPPQWRLAKLLRRPGRFFAVGDINQAIYGFRHARPEGFRELRDEVLATGGAVDRLRANFRSRPEILAATEALLEGAPGMEPPLLVAAREFSDCAPAVSAFRVEEGQFAEEAAEAARRAAALVEEGFTYREIAFLFRTTARIAYFEAALTKRGMPYRVTGGQTFFDQTEVADVLAWLRLLANPADGIALATVLRSPLGGAVDSDLPAFVTRDGGPGDRLKQTKWWAHVEDQRRRAEETSPDILLTETLDGSSYWEALSAQAIANVEKLLGLIRDEWRRDPRPLAALADYFHRRRELSEEPNAPAAQSGEAIQLMTMHAAKGLEFPAVFLPSLDLRGQSDSHDLMYTAEHGVGAKWRMDGESRKDHACAQMAAASSERDKEEGNRLLFVAMTRAERRLILSHAAGARRAGFAALFEKLPIGVPG